MDKPKKKDLFVATPSDLLYGRKEGYNHCWDEREKWLKSKQMSVEEIEEIIELSSFTDSKMVATAIHKEQLKRLEGE